MLVQSSIPEVDNINFSKKEDEKVDEKLEMLEKYNLTLEELHFDIDEISPEELNQKLKEFTKVEEVEDKSTENNFDKENVQSDKIEINFSATYRQKREALQNALDPKIERDADGNIIFEEYLWVEDFDDTYVFVEKSIWSPDNYERKYGRFTYTFDEETIMATISGVFEEMVLVWLTLEENQKLQEDRNSIIEFEKVKAEFDEYKNNYSILETELTELKQYKSDIEQAQQEEYEAQQDALKLELIENFSKILTPEEVKSVQDENLSAEDMQTKFELMFAKKELATKFNKKQKKNETEIPLLFKKKSNTESWTSCIKK